MTRFMPRWPVMFDVRLLDVRLCLRKNTVRPGRRRVRPDLVILEDRVVPAGPMIPLDLQSDVPEAPARIVMLIDNPVPKDWGIPAPEASPGKSLTVIELSTAGPMVNSEPPPIKGQSRLSGDDVEVTEDQSQRVKVVTDSNQAPEVDRNNADPSAADLNRDGTKANVEQTIDGHRSDNAVAARRVNTKREKHDEEGRRDQDVEGAVRVATVRSFLVPIRVMSEAAAANLNGVSVLERSVPTTVTTATATATTVLPTATTVPTVASPTPAAASQPVLLGADVLAVATPLTTPTAVPGPSGTFTPTQTAAGVVLANFTSAALSLPRSGGDTPTGDVGFRPLPPSTGIPVDGSTTPGRTVPLPAAGSGAGVVTEEVPELTLPPIELVPSASEQSAPVAPIDTGISGTAVFVATVAAIGLLAGAYYSQIRRSGRGPRLRWQR